MQNSYTIFKIKCEKKTKENHEMSFIEVQAFKTIRLTARSALFPIKPFSVNSDTSDEE